MKMTTKSEDKSYFKTIAQNRGEKWRKNMLQGRRDAQLNPSVLRLARLRKPLHQSMISEKLGMSTSSFGAVERGKRRVDLDTAKKIARLVAVPMSKLFKSTGKKFVAVIQKQEL